MSEFSSGILFLGKSTDFVKDAARILREPYFVRSLNPRWSGFFPAATELESSDAPWLLELSHRLPLLLLKITDDYGWGYEILKAGQVTAALWVNYELEWSMAEALTELRYPQYAGESVAALMTRDVPFDDIMQEVVESDAYRRAVEVQYVGVNVAEWADFEVAPDAIAELKTILTGAWVLKQDMFSQVDEFKDKIGLTGFDWMSYYYLSRREGKEGETYE